MNWLLAAALALALVLRELSHHREIEQQKRRVKVLTTMVGQLRKERINNG